MGRVFIRPCRFYSSIRRCFSEAELCKLRSGVRGSGAILALPAEDSPPPERRVLALLVGWASSSSKAVVKHSSVYTEVGIPAICLSPSVLRMWSSKAGTELSRSLLRSVHSSLEEEPVSLIIHSFSSGTSSVLPFMAADYESREPQFTRKLVPTCAVFDSGPADFSHESGMAGARLIYKQGGYNAATYLASICVGTAVNALIGRRKRLELRRVMSSPLLDVPQLYLHSESDQVARPAWVQQVMQGQRTRGRDVTSHCWKDQEHVRLYLNDPETYKQQIHLILRKCNLLAGYENNEKH